MNESGTAVAFEGLTRVFGDFTAVDRISLSIAKGDRKSVV